MIESGSNLGALEWGAIGLGLSAFVLTVVLTRINIRQRIQERLRRRAEARALVDLEFIEQLSSAATAASVAELFDAMAQDCRRSIADIQEAAKMSEFDAMQDECAALAESCEAFGAKALAVKATALRRSIRDRDFSEAGRLMVEIETVADRTFKAISRSLKESGQAKNQAAA